MLQQLLNLTVGTIAVAGTIAEDERSYELLSATLDGRLLVAFVDYQGAAVAVDLTHERPEIITGLAAGAILSDLREATTDVEGSDMRITSGLGHSEVRVDGAVRVGQASREQVLRLIEDMPRMQPLHRQQLKSTLGL
ncbi:MAG: hypothetical protein AAGA69_01585 [Pseudomonadota bacterium]